MEVRLALLEEGPAALLGLVGLVEEHRRVPCELLEAGQAVRVRVERPLQQADRRRALLEDLVGPAHPFGLQLGEWHDRVDEAHREGLPSVVLAAEVPDLARPLLPDGPGEEPDAEASVEAAHLRARLAEDRVLGRDREVAHDVEDVPAADRVAVDERDHRDRQRADEPLQVEDVEAGDAVRPDVAAASLHALVAARAERLVAGTGEEGDADRWVVADVPERVDELGHGLRPEGVADFRSRDRDARDPGAGLVVADVGELADRGPGDGHHGSLMSAPRLCGSEPAPVGPASRNPLTSRRNAAGRSRWGAWPAPSTIARRASGRATATASARRRPVASRAPAMTSAGAWTTPSSPPTGRAIPCPAPRRLAARPSARL